MIRRLVAALYTLWLFGVYVWIFSVPIPDCTPERTLAFKVVIGFPWAAWIIVLSTVTVVKIWKWAGGRK